MQKVSQLEVKRGKEFLQILRKIDLKLGEIGYKLAVGLAILFIVIGIMYVSLMGAR